MLKAILRQLRPHSVRHGIARADEAFRQGHIQAALAGYEQVLRGHDADALAHYHYGLCLARVDRNADAITAFKRSLALDSTRYKANVALAETALKAGDPLLARAQFRTAVAAAPQPPAVWMRLAKLEYGGGSAVQAAGAYEQAWRSDPRNAVAASNYLYCSAFSSEIDSATLLDRSVEWGRRAAEAATPAPALQRAAGAWGSRRIRIAYVSPDLRDHPMQFFFMPLLRAHDRARFKVVCLNDAPACDTVQQNMRAVSAAKGDDAWIDCREWSDERLAQWIIDESVDVLVDLAGHTRANRLAMMARRCAPLQITALGYPCTTGLSTMDLKLSDAIADPPGADRHCSERVARMASGFWCFEPPTDAPEVTPALQCLERPFTFGCFGEPCKISNEVLAVWAVLFKQLPQARLLLKLALAPGTLARDAMLDRLGAAGMPLDRVDLHGPTVPLRAFLQWYGRVDIILDTWPFNGGTTTCLALWMGVPVLTLAGDSMRSRMGASILERIGLPDWIANSAEDYVARARRNAESPEAARYLRGELRRRMAVLTDANTWVYEFERLCEQALNHARHNGLET